MCWYQYIIWMSNSFDLTWGRMFWGASTGSELFAKIINSLHQKSPGSHIFLNIITIWSILVRTFAKYSPNLPILVWERLFQRLFFWLPRRPEFFMDNWTILLGNYLKITYAIVWSLSHWNFSKRRRWLNKLLTTHWTTTAHHTIQLAHLGTLCMVSQRGQYSVFLLEHKHFCARARKFVLKHKMFLLEHKLCALPQSSSS